MTPKDYRQKNPIVIFLSYFRNHMGLFALDLSCAIAIALIDLSFPLVTRQALYTWLPEGSFHVFFTAMGLCMVMFLIRAVLNFCVTYYGHTFGIRVEADIRRDLFAQMQRMSFSFYDENRTGQLMSRLTTDLFDLTELAHHGPEDLITSGITIVGALVVMVTIRWELAVVVGILVPAFVVLVMSRRASMSRASAAVKQKTGHINTEIESSLSGIRAAKAFGNEAVESMRFNNANEQFKTSKREFQKAMGIFSASMELFLTTLNVAVIATGGYMILKNRMDYRDLITFSLYIATFVNPMRKISTMSELFAGGFAGLKRFVAIMGTEPEIADCENAVALTDVKGSIEVKDVHFGYKEDVEVLHGVSLNVQAGQTVAVVGPSGGGKTTLCQLIPRFYEAQSGAICIDGHDIRTVTQESLHNVIGIVQQDVFLFADTIRENIRYGRPGASDEEVVEAARQAEILDDILAMPAGFDTYVGERGTLLSGGQKQRVSIARIFLKNPAILILDEATSALDSVTEAKIQRAFDRLSAGRTTLIIAHRLSTIRGADRIIAIADGCITESGTHAELLAAGGIYAGLYNTQNASAILGSDAPLV